MAKPAKPPVKGKPGDKAGGSPSIVVPLVILTIVGGAAGFGFSQFFVLPSMSSGTNEPKPGPAAAADAHGGDHGGDGGHSEPEKSGSGNLVPIPPIVTKLGGDSAPLVRLEGSIVVSPDYPDGQILAASVSTDIISLLKTLTLDELQGVSGLNHLRDDINDRLSIRSEGKAREFIITTLAIE